MITLEGERHLFLGGAESVDKVHRVEGATWWAYESPTYEEFSTFFNAFEDKKPDVVVTHEAPLCVDCCGSGHTSMSVKREDQPTARNLQNIWKISTHRPARWYFGHHHVFEEWEVEGTTFRCCGLGGQYWAGA
jgi:5-methylcytosine-specific restriction endonuclease McrA